MSLVPITEQIAFEEWVIKTYPDLFNEWEVNVAEYIDLNEWLEQEHYSVIDAWRQLHQRRHKP